MARYLKITLMNLFNFFSIDKLHNVRDRAKTWTLGVALVTCGNSSLQFCYLDVEGFFLVFDVRVCWDKINWLKFF